MFTTNLVTFSTEQKELHQQARQYNLVRSLEHPTRWALDQVEILLDSVNINPQRWVETLSMDG